jgi:hypothetical protein
MRIGFLAFGSLLWDRGSIADVFEPPDTFIETMVPFPIEFARSSDLRRGGPIVIRVNTGKLTRSRALILPIKDEIDGVPVTVEQARYEVYNKERGRSGDMKVAYQEPTAYNPNFSYIKEISPDEFDDHGSWRIDFDVILYSALGKNIEELIPDRLAVLAIASARKVADPDLDGIHRGDGISFLINAVDNGIRTPLMDDYTKAILKFTGRSSLKEAYDWCVTRRS